ncbi:MAG: alkylhydroperoxidase [Rhodobacterales bacterium]|nr:MAG: alkylhydroperoxidase [Rhodobacterales bacterium]
MDFKTLLADTSAGLAAYRKVQPEGAKGFSAMHQAAMVDGAISLKDKELMCIAIGIVSHCNDCIGFHVKAGLRLGMTREELAEVVSVCMYMGGGPAYMYGAHAMAAFDELSA